MRESVTMRRHPVPSWGGCRVERRAWEEGWTLPFWSTLDIAMSDQRRVSGEESNVRGLANVPYGQPSSGLLQW